MPAGCTCALLRIRTRVRVCVYNIYIHVYALVAQVIYVYLFARKREDTSMTALIGTETKPISRSPTILRRSLRVSVPFLPQRQRTNARDRGLMNHSSRIIRRAMSLHGNVSESRSYVFLFFFLLKG